MIFVKIRYRFKKNSLNKSWMRKKIYVRMVLISHPDNHDEEPKESKF